MKLFKIVVFLTLSAIILTSFTQCKSSKKTKSMEETAHSNDKDHDHSEHANEKTENEVLEYGHAEQTENLEQVQSSRGGGKQIPLFIRDTYFEKGVNGFNIYFPTLINKSNYKLEKVYFRGMIGEMISGKASYHAVLKSKGDAFKMSNNENAEYGNTMPKKAEPFPFELKDNECMLTYMDNGKVQYFQVYNIVKKR